MRARLILLAAANGRNHCLWQTMNRPWSYHRLSKHSLEYWFEQCLETRFESRAEDRCPSLNPPPPEISWSRTCQMLILRTGDR
jgi:hypothetical protein